MVRLYGVNVFALIFSGMMVTVCQLVLQLLRRDGSQVAILDAEDRMRVVDGVDQVVRYHEDREFQFTVEAGQQLVKCVGVSDVDPSSWFVQYEEFRMIHQCPGDQDPLKLPAGKRTDACGTVIFHPD